MATGSESTAGEHSVLSATYSSLHNQHFAVVKDLQITPEASVESKTNYLNALRQAVVATQEEVNKELTTRMEEDKVREGAASKTSAEEEKEEENYGEENVDADE